MNTQTQPQARRLAGGVSDTLIDIETEDQGDPFDETLYSYHVSAPARPDRLAGGGISDTLLNW